MLLLPSILTVLLMKTVVPQSGTLPPRMLMFSATFPKAARIAARDFTNGAVRQVQIGGIGTLHQNIAQMVGYLNSCLLPATNYRPL